MSTKEVVMTEEWNESDDFKRVGTEGLSGEDIGEKSLTYRTNGHRTGLSADRCVDQESGTKQCTLVWYR
mgnify:CR=1 FL=1